jgi:3-phenylpropionate/trans-cinnamate dioxygenase ferredoxin reductase component
MARALSSRMSDHVAGAHPDMGTDLRLGEGLAVLEGCRGSVVAAAGTSGRDYRADLVVLGVGAA